MTLRFLLAPAGSGKTFRCLQEIRAALSGSQEGAPLVLLTPKQTTYQLERQLLSDPSLDGYSRLHILSFERLAYFALSQLGLPGPDMLQEEGRVMVFRSLITKRREQLKLFRASARLTGFARELSGALGEFQRHQQTPDSLRQLAANVKDREGLGLKLHDLATLFHDYLQWLANQGLNDADSLLASAAESLNQHYKARGASPGSAGVSPASAQAAPPGSAGVSPASFHIEQLWVDGFTEWSGHELDLLAAVIPFCGQATVTFCLDDLPKSRNWLSPWSAAQKSFEDCESRLRGLPGVQTRMERVPRTDATGRFVNPVLRHLERSWAEPVPYASAETSSALRIALCPTPEAEATLAAHEILRHVKAGGRYREIAVLVRDVALYHQSLQRVLSRYGIPFFLDRRESVSHHPLAELTRGALRTLTLGWKHEDFFAALKTGLAPADERELDWLENEALARGWQGAIWQKEIVLEKEPSVSESVSRLQKRLVPPFLGLQEALGGPKARPDGRQLAEAVRAFWNTLRVDEQLSDWATGDQQTNPLGDGNSVHLTVWEQLNVWLDNVELAFPLEAMPLREWLPILEAGLADLTVGLIPPALDQVLVGTIDRSRNPEIKLALILGMNEGVFPAPPARGGLLTESDRYELERLNLALNSSSRRQMSRERYLAYLACTRPRERLVLTCAARDGQGSQLNPSPFLAHVCRLFPSIEIETISATQPLTQSEHVSEVIIPLIQAQRRHSPALPFFHRLSQLPEVSNILQGIEDLHEPALDEILSPALARRLYGPVLRTSVSGLEQFAACPFRFFINSGLHAQERKRFELDSKELGNVQHEVLAEFHQALRREGKHWRDITPAEARERIHSIARRLLPAYREGLMQTTEAARFTGRMLTESLQDFVETLVGWTRSQYGFEPTHVEFSFGERDDPLGWEADLSNGAKLVLRGRIDRVDLCTTSAGETLAVVVDYKSSPKQLDPVLLANGVQLQLLSYLNVLRRWPNPREHFGADRLVPAGVFYVNLRGKYDREPHRLAALAKAQPARKLAYRHTGRFDGNALRQLDSRAAAQEGDQFKYRLLMGGGFDKRHSDAMANPDFLALLDSVEAQLRRMGDEIFSGIAKVAPYRKGSATACEQCAYTAICRIDPWQQQFRILRKEEG